MTGMSNGWRRVKTMDGMLKMFIFMNFIFIWVSSPHRNRYLYVMQKQPGPGDEKKNNGGGSGEGSGEGTDTAHLYKRYRLSEEKTFKTLFFREKEHLLRIVDHFQKKSGKYSIAGFPHKLGLLLHGPPGTGKVLICVIYLQIP
jgi:hypothetical protein